MEGALAERLFFRFLSGLLALWILASPSFSQTTPEKPSSRAKAIKDITFSVKNDAVTVDIEGDGILPDQTVLQIFNPPRLALDFPLMTNASQKWKIQVGHPILKEIRLGRHPGKVRVVFQFPGESIPFYQIAQKGFLLSLQFRRAVETVPSLGGKKEPQPVRVEKVEPKTEVAQIEPPETKLPTEKGKEAPPVMTEEPAAAQRGSPPEVGRTEVAKIPAPGLPARAKVSLDYKDADIRLVLQKIAEASQLNIIISEAVQGTLTLRLIDVPWDEALDVILEGRELAKIREGNTLHIGTQKEFEQRNK